MEKKYAQALFDLLSYGSKPDIAVAAIARVLAARGRLGLLRRVGAEYVRMSERHAHRSRVVLTVARADDAVQARHAAHVPNAEIGIDSTLIGGWRLEKSGVLVDASYKRYLLELFNRATR